MYQALQKLKVLGTVLYVAAHPDDENTRLLSYLSKDRLYRTGYLSITRGDGGQNLIGDEQGIELGLIRTQELLAARRIDGAEQFFTRAFDFGYSKNPEETFAKWDKEKALADVVWVIRKFQPDVVITRFPTTGEGGHGHHTASAILANEAFTAAADPNRYPEQLQYVKPWQVKRVLWNTFNFGGTNTTREDQFKLDVGGYNPLLGKSYGEIAATSRSQHKSQGFGVAAGRGEALEYFSATKGGQPTTDLMEGVETNWTKIKGGEKIEKFINKIISSFDFIHPEKSVKDVVKLRSMIQQLPDGNWKTQKLRETQMLIEQLSGLWIDAFTSEQYAVQTDSIRINVSVNNRMGVNANVTRVAFESFDSTLTQKLDRNRNLGITKTVLVPLSKKVTQPYWLEEEMAEGYYNVSDQRLIGQPGVSPSMVANVEVSIEGEKFSFERPVRYRFTDPVRGELYQPLVILPPVLVRATPSQVIKTGDSSYPYNVFVTARKDYNTEHASLRINQGNSTGFLADEIPVLRKNETRTYTSYVLDTLNLVSRDISFLNGNEREQYNKDIVSIRYDHIPYINYFKKARINITPVDLKTYGRRIGYIVGAGDKVPEALEQMGYDVVLLTEKELSRNNLRQYDAIISGVRAYNTNEWLNNHYEKLMKYVEDGGNLIVQYNTSSNLGPVRAKIGPFKFNISRTRVTNENAPVTLLKPEHTVLNFPNKITEEDFKGWIQERSIYHASEWDKNFETILSIGDPGEKQDEGSLIIARHGKGTFVYTGLVFFRELPAGVPGAYRLMANLIALNKQKAF